MQKYIIRSVKYLVMLCVLLAAVVWLNTLVDTKLSYSEYWQALLSDKQGKMMVVATLLLAATYPKFGYVTRRVSGSFDRHREQVVAAFQARGFILCGETDDELCFRATGLKRLTSLFEDEIVVRKVSDSEMTFAGLRRHAVQIALATEHYIENFERNKNNE